MLAVLEGRQHGADGTEGSINAKGFCLLEQPVAALHQARRPPGAVGIERPHASKRVGHYRHGAKVLHRADNLVALGAGSREALVFCQQEIPQPERGRGVVKAQVAQAEVAVQQDVAAQRPAVKGFTQAGAIATPHNGRPIHPE